MKKITTILSLLCLTFTSCFSFTACGNDAESADTLVVLNYGKYIEKDVLKRFQKETGIKYTEAIDVENCNYTYEESEELIEEELLKEEESDGNSNWFNRIKY